jgi:hypothetical protein
MKSPRFTALSAEFELVTDILDISKQIKKHGEKLNSIAHEYLAGGYDDTETADTIETTDNTTKTAGDFQHPLITAEDIEYVNKMEAEMLASYGLTIKQWDEIQWDCWISNIIVELGKRPDKIPDLIKELKKRL